MILNFYSTVTGKKFAVIDTELWRVLEGNARLLQLIESLETRDPQEIAERMSGAYISVEVKDDDISKSIQIKGEPGSGHHGHRGRPGKRGGSAPGGGLSESAEYALSEMQDNEWTREVWNKWGAQKEIAQSDMTEDDFVELGELFDLELYDTDGEQYTRTAVGDEVWDVSH